MIQTPVYGFHAHIYFEPKTRASAEALRQLISEHLGQKLRHWGELIDRPIGPHPLPMFEIDFSYDRFGEVVTLLMQNHGNHSVLIHPQTGDDLKDHTTHALWLGVQQPLELGKL